MTRVFSVGDLNVDIFMHYSGKLAFGEEHAAKEFSCTIGGNAANFAMALSGLRGGISLVSCIGTDYFTAFLRKQLSKHGIKQVLARSESPNGASNIFVDSGGERAIVSTKGCLLGLDSKAVSSALLPRLSRGDVVFIGGYFHFPKMRHGFPALLKAIKRKGGLVCFDTCFDEYGSWKVKPFIRHVDYFFVNEVELAHITKARSETSGVRKLLGWGAKCVVLKKGHRGAEFHSAFSHAYVPAENVKVINSTAAGDFFNAGFAHGMMSGFSPRNCLVCGNIVAGQKISHQGYFVTRQSLLSGFLRHKNLTELKFVKNYNELSRSSASEIMRCIKENPRAVLSLAAGKTPVGTYRALARAYRQGKVDFSKACFIELDEYLGLSTKKDSFACMLERELLGKVNFRKQNVFLFSGEEASARAECREAESVIRRKGIDFLLLGIGKNGHIAFNEPGSPFSSGARVVQAPRGAIRARGTKFSGRRPSKAVTLGMRTILRAKQIILIANGRQKAHAVAKAFGEAPTEKIPASALQLHGNASFIGDRQASALLRKRVPRQFTLS